MAIDFEPETQAAPKIDFEPEQPKIDFEPEASQPNADAMQAYETGQAALSVALTPVEANRRVTAESLSNEERFRQIGLRQDEAQQLRQKSNAIQAALPERLDDKPELAGTALAARRAADTAESDVRVMRDEASLLNRNLDMGEVGGVGNAALRRSVERAGETPSPLLTFMAKVRGGLAHQAAGLTGSEYLREVGTEANTVADLREGALADIARGAADVNNLLVGNPTGKLGVGLASIRGAAQSYSETLAATGSEQEATKAAVGTFPALMLFMGGGAAASKGVGALVGDATPAVTKAMAQFAGAELANVGVDAVLHAASGEPYGLRSMIADTLFALHHGFGGYKGTDEAVRAKAEAELKDRGFTDKAIAEWQPPESGQTPAVALVEPKTGEPNALENQISGQTDGGVRARSEIPVVPTEESSAGVQPSGQGGMAPETRSEAPSEVTRELGPGAANVEEFTARPVREVAAFNDAVDQRRIARGEEPLQSAARERAPDTWDKAVERIDQDPELPRRLIDEINSGTKKSVSAEEQSAILWKLIDLENRRLDAEEKAVNPGFSEEDRAGYKADFERLDAELNTAEEANRKAGTFSGRGLNIRRLIATENFTYARMLRRAEITKGEPLTDKEKADIKKESEGIQRTEKELSDKEQGAPIDAEIERAKGAKGLTGKPEEQAALATKLAERVKAGEPLSDLRSYIQRLVESLVRGGIKQRDPLVDRVHEILKGIDDKITRRQTADLISGYGDFKPLNPDQIKREVRDIKGQLQQVAKLEDIEAKRPLQKTGVERRTPSDEERRLIQAVNEAKKKYGVVVTDPANQLKSALDATKTRLKNQIKDITHRIETGERIEKSAAPEDEQIVSLRALRDRVRETLTFVEGKPEMSEAQRIASAKRGLEGQIKELERRISQEDTRPKSQRTPTKSAELDALRAQRDALRETYSLLKSIDPENLAREEVRTLKALKTAILNRNADIAERIAKEDFGPRPKKPPVDLSKDPEAVRAKAENERLKAQFLQRQNQWKLAQRTAAKKVVDTTKEVLGASRSLVTAYDISAPFRQGGFISIGDLVTNPRRFARQGRKMLAALRTEKGFNELQAAIDLRPNSDLYKESGLYLSSLDEKPSAREENMRSNLAEKIPGVRASNRAYAGFLNEQRADTMDAFVQMVGGKDKVTADEAKFFAQAINEMTGRGELDPKYAGAANFLARYLFSPRFLLSRIRVLVGEPIWRDLLSGKQISAKARGIVALQYAKFVGGLAALYGLGTLAGGKVEKDPRSTDFGKVRFGDTRIDPMAGLQQLTVLISRAFGKQKTSSGELKATRFDTLANFGRSKLAPIPGMMVDLTYGHGKNVVGEEVTPGSAAVRLALPMSYQDVPELYRKQGPVRGTIMEMLNLMGMGLQQYGKKP